MNAVDSQVNALANLNVAKLPTEKRQHYANALASCRFAASFSEEAWRRKIVRLCDKKLTQIGLTPQEDASYESWLAKRRKKGMEPFTRIYQWRIAEHNEDKTLSAIQLLTETLEADNRSCLLRLPYRLGDRPAPFTPSNYNDDTLAAHINALAKSATYIAREELIEIADHIQTQIVEQGTTADHISLITTLLSTTTPRFNYPTILKALEKATRTLTKSGTPLQTLAPTHYLLWTLTLKQTHLSRYEKALRSSHREVATG